MKCIKGYLKGSLIVYIFSLEKITNVIFKFMIMTFSNISFRLLVVKMEPLLTTN